MATTHTDTNVNQLVINKCTKEQYDSMPSHSSTELYLVEEELDTVVTQNSDNPVTSGAVYNALQNVQGTTYTLSANNEKVVLTPSSGTPDEVSLNALINGLDTSTSNPQDDDYIIAQYAGGGTTTTTYHRRPLSKFWNWIKTKLGSVGSVRKPVYFNNGVPTECGTFAALDSVGETRIRTQGEDLNTYTTVGIYGTGGGWAANTAADSMLNRPTGMSNGGFKMIVEHNGWDESYIRQTIYHKNGDVFTRVGYLSNNSMTWLSWKQLTTADISGKVNKTGDTMSGLLTLPSLHLSGGRVYGAGDDEGIVITQSSNNCAGLTLGDPSNRHSTFYMNSQKAFWRYNNNTTNYDIEHPSKSGVIALTSDIDDLRNKYYSIQEGILPNAIFTINSYGRKIIFSKGNLIVSSNNDKYFRFAENQYSPIRSNGANISQTGNRDLIAAACWSGYNTNIDPLSVSTNDSDYSFLFGIGDFLGKNFWSPFSKYEIDYILFSRTGTYVFCKARVNSFNGIILFPDAFTNYGGISFTGLNSMSTSYSSNVITKYQFATLESQGCVFLPCGGTRLGTTVDSTKNEYYTSTTTATEEPAIYCLNLDGTNQLTTIVQRNTFATGRCVRLIHHI